jgi:hypothetical protein
VNQHKTTVSFCEENHVFLSVSKVQIFSFYNWILGPVFHCASPFNRLLKALVSAPHLTSAVPFKKSQRARPMAALERAQSDKPSTKKLIRQRQYRRKTNMMKKASEYSKMCDADVCVGIRMRETGQIHILSADTSGFWAFLRLQLVCKHK